MIKEILLLILVIYTNSRTESYYTTCQNGAPSGSNLVMASECTKYKRPNSYCCLLFYEVKDINVHFSIWRRLNERVNLCYGLTEEGYNNIDKVKSELKSESEIVKIEINCFSSNIKFIYGFLILILLFF
jgi:hypothetical protein